MTPDAGNAFALSSLLFTIGVVGLVLRRNLVVQAMCLQIMLGAGQLAMAAFARLHGATQDVGGAPPEGELLIIASLVIGAAQLGVGLGLVFGLVRQRASVDADDVGLMRG